MRWSSPRAVCRRGHNGGIRASAGGPREPNARSGDGHPPAAAIVGTPQPDFNAGRQALPQIGTTTASAVIAFNDQAALGLLSALREASVSVPGDISVVGCDDSLPDGLAWPSLTWSGWMMVPDPTSMFGFWAMAVMDSPAASVRKVTSATGSPPAYSASQSGTASAGSSTTTTGMMRRRRTSDGAAAPGLTVCVIGPASRRQREARCHRRRPTRWRRGTRWRQRGHRHGPIGRPGSGSEWPRNDRDLSLIHISEPTRLLSISYA